MSFRYVSRYFWWVQIFAFWALASVLIGKMIYKKIEKIRLSNASYFCDHLAIPSPVTQKKPMAVVIASYNNESFCEKNLESVFNQTYKNYRVIYIDDCSVDGTFDKVSSFIKKREMGSQVTLIRNSKRQLKMANLYRAIHLCEDHEIVVVLDGDDWLDSNDVLETINRYYQDPDVWVTYGSTITYPKMKQKANIPVNPGSLAKGITRFETFRAGMLRTFYAGLFKVIPLKELCYKGEFLRSADDVAYMTAMFEMAPEHVRFSNKILYVINDSNPIRSIFQEATLQDVIHEALKKRNRLKPLSNQFRPFDTTTAPMLQPVSLVILSRNGPEALDQCLQSSQKNISPISSPIQVLYVAEERNNDAFQALAKAYPNIEFYDATSISNAELQNLIESDSARINPYILVITDDCDLQTPINVRTSIEMLEKSQAEAFFIDFPVSATKGNILLDNISFGPTVLVASHPEAYIDSFKILLNRDLAFSAIQSWTLSDSFTQRLTQCEGLSLFYPKRGSLN